MYDPLVYTVWWFIAHGAQLDSPDLLGAKLNPMIFHAANLAVHWLTACLVVEILLKLKLSPWPAAGGALIFAVHPIQTEAVVWATGMKDLLCGFFCMATILAHLAGANKIGAAAKKNNLAELALFLAALLSKPSAVVLPAIIVLLDILILRRPLKQSVISMIPALVLAALAVILASALQAQGYIPLDPLWARPFVAADALAFYMAKLILPIDLSFDYGRSPATLLNDPTLHHALWWTWIFPAALAAILYHYRQNRRLIAAAGIFVLGLLPVLGLTKFVFQYYSTVADRYVYLSMLGVALAAGLLIQRFSKPITAAFVAAVAVLLTSLSFAQAGVWKDSETLYRRGLALNDRNLNHYVVYGQYSDREANVYLRRAQDALINGDAEQSHYFTREAQKEIDTAIDSYRRALRIDHRTLLAYDKLTYDLILEQRTDEAISVIQQLIDLQPNIPPRAREDPAALYYTLGMACYSAGRYPESVAALQKSLDLKPDPAVQQHLEQARQKMESATQPAGGPRP
jgi:tetratricopeptide (TPR) repeat protein